MDEQKWYIQADNCLLTKGVGCSSENTVTNERDLHVVRRRRDEEEESNILFFIFLILIGLMKGIFGFHIW